MEDEYKEHPDSGKEKRIAAVGGTLVGKSSSKKEIQDFDFKKFESFIEAARVSSESEGEEAENTLETAFFNMKNAIDFYFNFFSTNAYDREKIVDILNFLESHDFIGFLCMGIDYSLKPEINSYALDMFSLILSVKVDHTMFNNELLNEELVSKLFTLVRDPTVCDCKKNDAFSSERTLKSIFSSFENVMEPHLTQSIRQNALSSIVPLINRKPEFIPFIQGEGLVDILLEMQCVDKTMIETIIMILQIIAMNSTDDLDVYTRYFASNIRIENKPYIPALEGCLTCLKFSKAAEVIANNICSSNIGREILSLLIEQDIKLREVVFWIIMEITSVASDSVKASFVEQIEWEKFFRVPSDDKLVQLSLIAARVIILNCTACAEKTIRSPPFFNKFISYIEYGEFDIKKCSFVQLSKMLSGAPGSLIIDLVNQYQIDDIAVDLFDENDTELLKASATLGIAIINAFRATENLGDIIGKFFDSSIVETVDSFQDSNDSELAVACIEFMTLVDELDDGD